MTPPNPDLDARFAVFMNPIRDLTKNWEVDIAKYLEDYLVELAEVQITFDDGHTVMNFAEAAMLIQGSAAVYSKKVEFLWQMVLQMLDLLSTKKDMNLNGPGLSREGRQRVAKQNTTLEFESIVDISSGKNVDLKEGDCDEDDSKPFSFLPAIPLHLVEKESEKSLSKIPLFDKHIEPIGHKDDFRVNRCYVSPDGLLSLNLPLEVLNPDLDLDKSRCGFNTSSFSPLRHKPSSPKQDIASDCEDIDGELAMDDFVGRNSSNISCDVDEEKLNLKNDPNSISTKAEENDVEEKNAPESIRKLRSRPGKNLIETKNLNDPLKPLDPHLETPSKRPIRLGRIRKPVPCNCHKQPDKATARSRKALSKSKKDAGVIPEKSKNEHRLTIQEFLSKSQADFLLTKCNSHKLRRKIASSFPIDQRLVQELAKEELEKLNFLKSKKARELLANKGFHSATAAINGFNIDDARRVVEDFEAFEDNAGFTSDNEEDVPDLDLNDCNDARSDLQLPDPHKNIMTAYGAFPRPFDADKLNLSRSILHDESYEPSSDYEALVQHWVADYVNSAQQFVNSTELTHRVNRWREHVQPVLAKEETRTAFDIHEYGSKVLSMFGAEGDNLEFRDLVKGKERPEVARTFLSCLMLANTNNLELRLSEPGPLQMDCLELSLKTRERHHERIDEELAGGAAGAPTNRKRKSCSSSTRRRRRRRSNSSSSSSSLNSSSSEEEAPPPSTLANGKRKALSVKCIKRRRK